MASERDRLQEIVHSMTCRDNSPHMYVRVAGFNVKRCEVAADRLLAAGVHLGEPREDVLAKVRAEIGGWPTRTYPGGFPIDGDTFQAMVLAVIDRALASESGTAEAPSLDAAYRERNAVVAALIRVGGYPAEVVMAPDTEGWWIVYAETPAGQVSWHISPDDMDLFSDWPVAFGSRPSPWDGHTTDEKYQRVARLASREPTDG